LVGGRNSLGEYSWPLLTAALFIWLLIFQAARLYSTPLAYDDAYLAAAAKSLAFGHGYATHYPSVRPFDVQLGVGLTLEFPAAGLIALFGNEYWVPGLTTVLTIDILLVAIFFQLKRRLPITDLYRVATAGLLALAVLTADSDEWLLSHWYAFLGDIPSALAVILAILFLARDLAQTGAPRASTGLLMGLAINVKLVAVLGVAPAMLFGVLVGHRSARGSVRNSSLFIIAALVPSVLVQLWQLWTLGVQGYFDHLVAWQAYLATEGSGSGFSGVLAAIVSDRAPFSRALVNGPVAIAYLGGAISATAVVVLTALIAVQLSGRRANGDAVGGENRIAAMLLWLALVVHAGWWAILSSRDWINHLLPAFAYLAASFAISLALKPRRSLMIATWTVAIVVAIPRLSFLAGYVPVFSQHTQIKAAMEVRQLLLSRQARGEVLIACGWWVPRDLEYLLPGVGNFRDCFEMDRLTVAGGRSVLVRNVVFWNWEQNPRMQAFADSCERTIEFRNAHYVLSRCTTLPGHP